MFVDPQNPINFNRKPYELEALLLFLIGVAGKKASIIAPRLHKLLGDKTHLKSPLMIVRDYACLGNLLAERMKELGFGCHNQKSQFFINLAYAGLDLRTCTLEQLVSVKGIGRKSASCFLMWTRPNQRVAGLDTHLLKELTFVRDQFKAVQDQGMPIMREFQFVTKYFDVNIPKSTPSSKRLYDILEEFWLEICDVVGETSAEYDLKVWKKYANKAKA